MSGARRHPPYGNFIITSAEGGFVPYIGQGGYIHRLDNALQPLNTTTGPGLPLLNWIVLSSSAGNPVIPPNIAFDLTFLFLGSFTQVECGLAPAAGQECTPIIGGPLVTPDNPLGLSAFNLSNTTATTSTASFTALAIERNLTTGEEAPVVATFSAQFTVPFQTVLAQLSSAPFSITRSYSGTLEVSQIPEPQTTTLLGGGLLILAGMGMRRFRRKA